MQSARLFLRRWCNASMIDIASNIASDEFSNENLSKLWLKCLHRASLGNHRNVRVLSTCSRYVWTCRSNYERANLLDLTHVFRQGSVLRILKGKFKPGPRHKPKSESDFPGSPYCLSCTAQTTISTLSLLNGLRKISSDASQDLLGSSSSARSAASVSLPSWTRSRPHER